MAGSNAQIAINVHRAGVRYQTGGTHLWTNVAKYMDCRQLTGHSPTTPFGGGTYGKRDDVLWTRTGYPAAGEAYHCFLPCFQTGTHEITWTGGASDVVYHNGDAAIGVTPIANKITLTTVPVGTNVY